MKSHLCAVNAYSHISVKHTHQSREALECSWDTNVRVDLDQDVPGSMNVNLEKTGLVQRTVQKGQQALSLQSQ